MQGKFKTLRPCRGPGRCKDSFQFLLPGDDTIHHIDNSLDRATKLIRKNLSIGRETRTPQSS